MNSSLDLYKRALCPSEMSPEISEKLFKAMDKRHEAIADSGCTRVMFKDQRMFDFSSNYKECRIGVRVGDGREIFANGIGDVTISTENGSIVTLPQCLYVPDLSASLLSIPHLDKEGFSTNFEKKKVTIVRNNVVLLEGQLQNGLYELPLSPVGWEVANVAMTQETMHRRLGHFATRKLLKMRGMVDGMEKVTTTKEIHCQACEEGKHKRSSFPDSVSKSSKILEILHMDLAGPSRTASLGNGLYALVIVDDFSNLYHVEILKAKSEAYSKAIDWIKLHENRTGNTVKVIRTDGGGEFGGKVWSVYFAEKGIQHQVTTPYTPEQNGKAERAVRTVKEGTRTYLRDSGLSDRYWAAAMVNFTYTRNLTMVSGGVKDETPFETFYGKRPDVSRLRVFGCVAFVHIPKETRGSGWAPKAKKCVFVGYGETSGTKGWVLYDPYAQKRIVSCHVTFWENERWVERKREGEIFPFEDRVNPLVDFEDDEEEALQLPAPQLEEDDQGAPEQPDGRGPPRPANPQEPELRRGNRHRRPPGRWWENPPPDQAGYTREVSNEGSFKEHGPSLEILVEQAHLASGECDSKDPRFNEAKRKELDSMERNKVWTLVPPVPDRKPIGSRWVCTDKLLADGSTMPKARLVAQGFSQIEGLDYQEIFAPVIKLESIRVLMSLITLKDMHFIQGDVKTAFLYGPLIEEAYLKQPPGMIEPGKEDWVCRLHKAIYGLHQAPRAFYQHMKKTLALGGFSPTNADQSIFLRVDDGEMTILGLYVDDAILASTSKSHLEDTRTFLKSHFEMTWNDEPSMLLGMEITRDREKGTLRLSQRRFAEEILATFGMSECRSRSYPLSKGFDAHIKGKRPTPAEGIRYMEFVGKLNYLARGTRPDLAFASSHLASFCSSYQKEHWTGCENVMGYIKGTLDLGITFSRHGNREPIGYSDADWATDKGDRRSIGGYVYVLGNGPISWMSKKQSIVARSSTEAEYIALDAAAREGIWLKRMLQELRLPLTGPLLIYEDNQSTIKLAKNPVNHSRTKHIAVIHHATRDLVEDNTIRLEYLQTDAMLADGFTKPLSGRRIRLLGKTMGLDGCDGE
jgi:hypothetical protein